MSHIYAQLDAGGVVVAKSALHSAVDYPHMIALADWGDANLGETYAGGVFTPPAPPAPSRVLTKLQYMGRFTDAELTAIYTAAKTVVAVEIWLDKFKLAGDIDLDDPRTIAGLQQMESAGLIAAGRAALIAA